MKSANEITLYIYYIKEKYESEYGEILPISNDIFAYTTDKKVAKLFEDQRNMKLFKKDKKELSIQEYNDFVHYMIDNEDRYLFIHNYDFYTRDGSKLSKDMAITTAERRRIDGRKAMLEINITTYCWYSPEIFNEDIYKALKILKYNDISDYIGSYKRRLSNVRSIYNNSSTIDDIIKINYLNIVIDVIGRTLKE